MVPYTINHTNIQVTSSPKGPVTYPSGMRRSPDVSPRRLSDISPQLRQLKYLVVDEAIKEDLKWSRSVEDLPSASVGLTPIEERILRITGYYGYQPWAASYKNVIPWQAWSPLSSLSPNVSWVLADVVLHCYTAAATHCLVAADSAIGLKTILIMSEMLLAALVSPAVSPIEPSYGEQAVPCGSRQCNRPENHPHHVRDAPGRLGKVGQEGLGRAIRSHTSRSVHAGALLRFWDSIMVTSADELCTHLQLAMQAKQEIEIQKFTGLFLSTWPVHLI
ncbi:hypothetical protein UY3_15643 [Chelonia mydas]|uniref:Uncharacterized protein n=1 Tax=Chelonia mydas TaxID=8469 RepID=M7B553_CHEMY|nr:hypothetical protein UY3_15643 [Chelonia mydas]